MAVRLADEPILLRDCTCSPEEGIVRPLSIPEREAWAMLHVGGEGLNGRYPMG